MTTLATAPTETRDWLASRSEGPMEPGSVLFHAPSAVFQAPGGGENQLYQTGRHLEERGVPVRLFRSWTDRIDRARLLHLFGMSREGLELARVAGARGVPVVLSPICWFEPRALAALAASPARAALDLAKWAARRLVPSLPGWRRELLARSSAVLPNSSAEARQLAALFGADPGRIHPVPNGVSPRFEAADPALFRDRHGEGDFVLFVGRVEPRKNLLGLIRGLGPLNLPLVVAGEAPPAHRPYRDLCDRAGRGRVRWLGGLDHDDPMLASAYAACRVFALPSWFETPGLAALEAGLAGAPVVITPLGCTREYFADLAQYADPGRPAAIGAAVRAAWTRGRHPELARRIAERYPWSEVARRTAEVYDQVAG